MSDGPVDSRERPEIVAAGRKPANTTLQKNRSARAITTCPPQQQRDTDDPVLVQSSHHTDSASAAQNASSACTHTTATTQNADSHGCNAAGIIGSRQRKIDGVGKAVGSQRFTDDISLPGMLHGKILRSPHAHARILSIDVSDALAIQGVHAIITGADLPTPYGIIPWTHDETALCRDKALFIGDEVAAVACDDEDTCIQALRSIKVEYEVLEAILDPQEALDRNEHILNTFARHGNITKRVKLDFGDSTKAIDESAYRVDEEFFFCGTTHAAIEPHCAIAHFEPIAATDGGHMDAKATEGPHDPPGQLTLWSSTQIPHYLHRELSRVLSLPPSRVRVIQPAVGGAFGGKSDPCSLEFCAAKLSIITGLPVKFLFTREEVFYAHRGRHPMRMQFSVGANTEGKLTGVRSTILIDGGAYASYGLVTAYYAGQLLTGPYHFPHYAFEATRVYTNKPPCGPKRGHGSVQPRFAFEVALDEIAQQAHIDPIEIRRRNYQGEGTQTINGQRITSNGFDLCLDAVERASSWTKKHGKLPFGRGVGVAGSMYISGTNYPIYPNAMPQAAVQVQIDRSGKVTIFSGASDIGQGSDSVVAYIACEELGCTLSDVRVVAADTDLCPVDLGAYSSRVTFMIGNATIDACRKLRTLIQEAVAETWELPKKQIRLAASLAMNAKDTGQNMPLREAFILAESKYGTLGSVGSYNTPKLGGDYRGGTIGASPAYSFTAHVAEVEVDTETGMVDVQHIYVAHDCGRALNPCLVEGQIEGSAYMGFAEALMEEQLFYDEGPQRGLLRGPSLLDYRIPTMGDTPELQALIIESFDPEGPYGAKEAGEGPLHPSIPAIANAIYDAVGVRLRSIPFYPWTVLAALKEQRGK